MLHNALQYELHLDIVCESQLAPGASLYTLHMQGQKILQWLQAHFLVQARVSMVVLM